MATSIRFLVVRRPGIYNTHSQVIQPMEHTLVNDGLPLLYKSFKSNMYRWTRSYLPQITSIDFQDVSVEAADEYISNPSTDNFEGATILINHPKQYKLAAFNMQQLYYAISDEKWNLTPSTLQYFGGSDNISTCLDYPYKTDYDYADWIKCDNKELINSSDITLRKTFRKYGQYISYLQNDKLNKELILFHSNHLSIPLSKQVGKIVKHWQPDTVLLESDAVRMDRYVHVMKNLPNMSLYHSLFHQFLDIGIAINESKNNVATHIVLADWNIAQYRIMLRIARYLDKMQSKDEIDRSTGITLHIIGQLFCPSLLPGIQQAILNEYYDKTLRVNQPHYHWVFSKRNDIFANTIRNCSGNRLVGIFGHSHVSPIMQRLTGEKQLSDPFHKLGSHNIQF